MLKEHSPDVYEHLGRPRLFSGRSLGAELRFVRFLLREEYRTISHQPTLRAAARCRIHFFVGLGLTVAGAATLGVGAFIYGSHGA
jgi:hypothetical protein